MADFARFLPLSQRRDGDESGVTSDRKALVADLVDEADRLIAASLPAIRREGLAAAFVADARLAPADPGDLRALATGVRTGRRRSVRMLSSALAALLRVADAVGEEPRLTPVVTGAVALHRSGAAPLERRAVVTGRTVRATDDGWSFGYGPVIEGRGRDIAAFLLGVSEVPPHPPVPGAVPGAPASGAPAPGATDGAASGP